MKRAVEAAAISSGTLSGIVTAVLLVLFIAVCIWAYSSRRREQFDEAARLPLEESDKPAPEPTEEDK